MSHEIPCQDCGGFNPTWFAPSLDWNLVMGGPEAKGDPGGYICPNCYIKRAEITGVSPAAWVVSGQTDAPLWFDIATAPRGQVDFLALIPWQRRHHQMVGCFAPDGHFRSWPGRSRYEPTHWMPLPDPPSAAALSNSPLEGEPPQPATWEGTGFVPTHFAQPEETK